MADVNLKICEVISIDDEYNSGRIKVASFPYDATKKTEDIQYAYPLLPKTFYAVPKIGEAVLVFYMIGSDEGSNRYYIGPIISQLPDLEYSNISTTALSNYPGETTKINTNQDLVKYTSGAFGEQNDICVYGRKGSDIILKEDDVRIRAGARVKSNNKVGIEFNRFNPAYLKLKYSDESKNYYNRNVNTDDRVIYNSSATLVADEINLLSHLSETNFNITDSLDLVTDENMTKILENAHVLPYGDVLVDFLKYFLQMFKEHAHPFPGKPTILPSGHQGFFDYDFQKILSKHVRIN